MMNQMLAGAKTVRFHLNVNIVRYLEGRSTSAIPDVDLMMKHLIVEFDYPLSTPVLVHYKCDTEFSLQTLIDRICKTYQRIYWENEETTTRHTADGTDGKYGIWGHNLHDLVIEGVEVGADGTVTLSIGS